MGLNPVSLSVLVQEVFDTLGQPRAMLSNPAHGLVLVYVAFETNRVPAITRTANVVHDCANADIAGALCITSNRIGFLAAAPT